MLDMSQKYQELMKKYSPGEPLDSGSLPTVWTELSIVLDLSAAIQTIMISHKKNLLVKVSQIYH
jgi:hypothetical protein